jgi:4-hydroxysphinganine ceramide fatty acyl 2-hydroxylase
MPLAEYLAWVHEPYYYDSEPKSARLFAPDWVEPLSKTVWWVVPAVWLPVVVALCSFYCASHGANFVEGGLLAAAGVLMWTLVEYSLHRWLFHADAWMPDSPWAIMGHFIIHGIHHKLPMDRYRLVFPPIGLLPLTLGVWAVFRVLLAPLPFHVFAFIYGVGLAGYVFYDLAHYGFHHTAMHPRSYLGRMKRYHMKHHFAGLANLGFGITTRLWDRVFGTELPEAVVGQQPQGGRAAR